MARLFDSISRASGGSEGRGDALGGTCVQVLAVSHSPTFQQLCRHVVRLTRGPQGTRLAEGGPAGEAAASAAAGGRPKRARQK